VRPGFVAEAGAARIADVERYLRAAAQRLERLPGALGAERDRLAVVAELEDLLAARLAARPDGERSPELAEVRWLLEELRVSLFAQALGTRRGAGPISAKRIRRLLDAPSSPARGYR
jgi:ATP-dependent helicase HrpA